MTYEEQWSDLSLTRAYSPRHELLSVSHHSFPTALSTRTYDAGGRLVGNALGNGLSETRSWYGDNLVAKRF